MSYHSRLSKAFKDVPSLPLTDQSRYILISDCHRGSGTIDDDFLKNQNLYFAALNYYYNSDYTYIELGDGDELWKNRRMQEITEIHSNVFWLMNRFHKHNRLYMLYGNHDIVKKQNNFMRNKCHVNDYAQAPEFQSLIANLQFHSGIIMTDRKTDKKIYLTHGHQIDLLNSVLWPLARFLVRYVWRFLEHLGFPDPTSAAKNNTHKEKSEKRLTKWAADHNRILIAGHTHRPMLGTPASPYFNTGSCVHPRCITCIEIQNRCFTLVKWTVDTSEDRTLYVSRQVLAGPTCIDDYV